nr:NAD(P)H-hydrate dehydratase [Ammoniphilus resinae]
MVNAQQMREMDRFAMDEIGIPGIILMEMAGQAVAGEVARKWTNAKVVVVAGHGNNGGDGFIAARHLANYGFDIKVWFIGDVQRMTADCRTAFGAYVGSKYPLGHLQEENWKVFREDLEKADLILDGLLGTGIKGELRAPMRKVIQAINEQQRTAVWAIDIPSGVQADTGAVEDEAVQAEVTVTFANPKWGHYLYPGAGYGGEIIVRDISFPGWIDGEFSLTDRLLMPEYVASLLPKRKRHSHKGTYGHILVIAGSRPYVGAPALAAMGAIRSGAGMVTMAVPKEVQSMVAGRVPEAIFWPWPDTDGAFSEDSWKVLTERMDRYNFTIVGPGIGQSSGIEWLANLIRSTSGPLLLDADALNLLALAKAKDSTILKNRKKQVILTPHPGEMARLTGKTVKQVEQNRPQVAREFAVTHQVYLVLKGTYPIIATPSGELFVSTRGSSALAKGGSGDVLSGMIASFAAQTGDLLSGTILGVYLHGMSGEFMDEYNGTPSDLGGFIGKAIQQLASHSM